ncbi:MAG: TonB-dependent receptor [Bacteroidales bacterium]|nr:TonB-dependent receptor [Bacteroidales bacterium]
MKGIIRDTGGEPVIGASVIQSGTSKGAITDLDGTFSITVPSGAELVISCIGYSDFVLKADSREWYEIVLSESEEYLDEVVVVGMNNRQTRRSVTGAISTIQTKDLVQSPVANISNALAGKLPGLITVQSSGEPGADASALYVRGLGTYGSSAPLVVIDGLPRDKADFDMLDANEIESITILKDASSSSLYGIQGANGVVVVTTRRGGGNGRPKISFTIQEAMQQPIRLPETMSSYEQAMYNRAVDFNDGQPLRYTDEILQIIKDGSDPYQYPNTDWFDVVLKDCSWQQQYNVNISGSAGKDNRVNYFVSGSYINQGTLLNHNDVFEANYGVKSKYERYNFRSNLDFQATKMLNIRIDLAGRLETRIGPSESFPHVFSIITTRLPGSQAIWNPDGTLAAGSALEIPYQNNPYGVITQSGYYRNTSNVMYGTISARHALDFITEGLSIQAYFSFENTNSMNRVWRQTFEQFWYRGPDAQGNPVYQDYSTEGRLAASTASYVERYTYYDVRLNYDRSFGKHQVNAQILGNRTLKDIQSSEYMYAYQGLSARAAYSYAQRYFLELNVGYNGSENFPKGRRYGVFPSFSAGWVLSDEPWMKMPSWIKILKLRGSYGTVGNDRIGGDRFLYVTEFGPGGGLGSIFPNGYYFGTTNGGTLAAGGHNEIRVGNTYVTWEKARKGNVGLDLSLFDNNVLNFTVDYFHERRDNILTAAGSVPDYVGIQNIAPRNSGKVLNQGVEGEIRVFKSFGRDFSFFTNLQMTWARNKVLENDQPAPEYGYQDLRGYEIGYDLGYHAIGYFKDEADIENSPVQNFGPVIPGDIKYYDKNGDGVIDPSDRVPIKCFSVPTLTGGLSIGINWRGIDFSMMFSGALGGSARLFAYPSSVINLNRWTKGNMDTLLPVAHTTANNNVTSDQNLMKTDYIKLRNIELGYNFPSGMLKKIRVSTARIYLNAQNVAVWDTMWLKDRDPESAGSGTLPYPLQRVFNIGLRFEL